MGDLRKIRVVWAMLGTTAFIVFTTWSLLAFRATSPARAALDGNETVSVTAHADFWIFTPRQPDAVGLAFFPGGLVDPVAYAPIAKAVAANGYAVVLVRLPRRGAFGGADGAAPLARMDAATRIFATRDTVADVEKLEATRHNLPAHARLVRIDGGNHSQFGYYGFQPGDWPATIDRETQQRVTVDAILSTLVEAERHAAR